MNANLLLDKYLEQHFPNLEVDKPLFYNADIGLRFEIGNPNPEVSDEVYFEQVNYRSIKLFKETHHENDDIFIMLYFYINRKYTKIAKINAFRHSMKNTKLLRNLSCKTVPLLEDDDEDNDGLEKYRYVLQCKVSDIKVMKFIFSKRPIFIINTPRHTILHFYDTRGLDIVGSSKEVLNDLYTTYNHWILDYDREQIDLVFNSNINNSY